MSYTWADRSGCRFKQKTKGDWGTALRRPLVFILEPDHGYVRKQT